MVAAIDGNFVVTSPNQVAIWEVPQGPIYLRSDWRYGPHDPTLLPQPYISKYAYLGAIPRKPMNDKDLLSIMWWNPTPGDFIASSGGVVDGIGKLSRARQDILLDMRKPLEERIHLFPTNNDQHTFFYEVLLLLERDMLNASSRIGSLVMTFKQMAFEVTEFQRCYLETRGLLDYIELYQPRMDGRLKAASAVAECVGTITSKPAVVQDFFTAGLPVWFIQPFRPGPFPHNILNVVTPFERADWVCIDKADPPFPAIYDGPLNDHEKHHAIHQFSRKWLVFKDPFQSQPTIQPSTSTRVTTSLASTSLASTSLASTSLASTSLASTSHATRGRHCKYGFVLCINPLTDRLVFKLQKVDLNSPQVVTSLPP
jgi:hypothetical protein